MIFLERCAPSSFQRRECRPRVVRGQRQWRQVALFALFVFLAAAVAAVIRPFVVVVVVAVVVVIFVFVVAGALVTFETEALALTIAALVRVPVSVLAFFTATAEAVAVVRSGGGGEGLGHGAPQAPAVVEATDAQAAEAAQHSDVSHDVPRALQRQDLEPRDSLQGADVAAEGLSLEEQLAQQRAAGDSGDEAQKGCMNS